MEGHPIEELNAGLVTYKDSLAADASASLRVEVAIVTFGGTVDVIHDFTTCEFFHPASLRAGGNTPMGQAIHRGVQMIADRKQTFKINGINYFRPWIFLITDGGPTDDWRGAAEAVRNGEAENSFAFFAIGVEGANFEILKQISVREPLKLRGQNFRQLFLWLSQSQQSISHTNPGDKVSLPPPTWAEV